jgi:peptide/nickel transport system substrate-binding protein
LDIDKAKAYFKKAMGGEVWKKGFRFTMEYQAGSGPSQAVAHIFQHGIESLNPRFRMDLRPMDWPAFLDAMNSALLPIFPIGWTADYPDPDDFAFPLMDSRGTYSAVQGYKNPEADRLIEKAAGELNPKKREQLYWKIQQIEYEDVPHVLIVESSDLRVQRDWVQGWVYNPIFPDSPFGSYFYSLYKKIVAAKPHD